MPKDRRSTGNRGRFLRLTVQSSEMPARPPASRSQTGRPQITPPNAATQHTRLQREHNVWTSYVPRQLHRVGGLAVVGAQGRVSQQEALEALGLSEDEFALRIFERSGVRRRHLDIEPSFLESNLQGRAEEVEQELLRQAVLAIDQLDLDPGSVGTVLTSSLYSLGCPSLAHG